MANAVVILSDIHIGSAYALFPPRFQLSTGALASLNVGQQYLLQCWRDFEQRIPERFDVLILNGDIIHGQNRKDMAADLTEVDPAWQQRAALELLGPVAARAKKVWLTQGSTYHSGEVARWEEQLGYQLCAQPDGSGHYAWDWLLLDVENIRLDIAHHQSSTIRYGSMPLEREIQFALMRGDEQPPPDLIIRSHVHKYRSINDDGCLALSTPAWQLQGRYVRRSRTPNRMFSRLLGGVVVTCWPERKTQGERNAGAYIQHALIGYRHPPLAKATVAG